MSDGLEQLYTPDILHLAATIPLKPLLSDAAYIIRATSPLCGSELTVSLDFDDHSRVLRLGYDVRACAFGQASLSVFANQVIGADHDVVEASENALSAFLKGNNIIGLWPDADKLSPVQKLLARHGAVMLPYRAYNQALAQHRAPHQGL